MSLLETGKSLTRPPVKQDRIVDTLRGQIVTGKYAPGSRLPNRTDLGRDFDASTMTIQRALDRLALERFVVSKAGHGTFVVPHPPHLATIALVGPAMSGTSKFYVALKSAARAIEAASASEFSSDKSRGRFRFADYETSFDLRDRRDTDRLSEDVVARRVGAILFLAPPHGVEQTPIVLERGVPRAAIQVGPSLGIPSVVPDFDSFLDRAIDHLRQRGRKRVAHLAIHSTSAGPTDFAPAARKHGLEIRPYWHQAVPDANGFVAATNVVHLMMELGPDKRPDALIIHDDNLVERAVAGLLAAGVRVPQDLEIVAHANFPSAAPVPFPITRLGFDCSLIIEKCLALIDTQRQGKSPRMLTRIPAQFVHELTPDHPPIYFYGTE